MKDLISRERPWSWLPTLYVGEAVPYVIINVLTVLMYTNLNVDLPTIMFYTSCLYLPWVIKPFWAPIVDITATKRKWVVWMQMLMCAGFVGVTLLLPTSSFFFTTLALFFIIAFFSATHDIAADGYYMLALNEKSQAAFIGVRSTFYRIGTLLGNGGLIAVAAWGEKLFDFSPNPSLSGWMTVYIVSAVFFFAIALYHYFILPVSADDKPHEGLTAKGIAKDFLSTFVKFFSKKGIVTAIVFMLLYRLPEALCIKIFQPFLVGGRFEGGLGMTLDQVAVTSGTTGVVALLLGGILGGILISRQGLKFWLWPMAASLSLPCALYLVLAVFQPAAEGMGFMWINVAVFVEQFGYGFGFTAYMLYLIYFARGEHKTSDYAFCTAFMALGMMVPGLFSGMIFEGLQNVEIFSHAGNHGYINYFLLVTLCSLMTFVACTLVKVDPSFGKKKINS